MVAQRAGQKARDGCMPDTYNEWQGDQCSGSGGSRKRREGGDLIKFIVDQTVGF